MLLERDVRRNVEFVPFSYPWKCTCCAQPCIIAHVCLSLKFRAQHCSPLAKLQIKNRFIVQSRLRTVSSVVRVPYGCEVLRDTYF